MNHDIVANFNSLFFKACYTIGMITNILSMVTVISGALMVLAVLLQARGASLGAGFGSSSELFTARRGTDKTLFDITIVLAVLFVGSLLAGLMIG